MPKKTTYDNTAITALKGADRVRKRPSVIFGSDGLDGCEHAFFEILSNAIDEAREGYGSVINVVRHADDSIEIEDFGRGVPVDYNPREQRYNWELVYCELYAGGKYNNNDGGSYGYSLGLNGLGACATQYSSSFMDVTVRRDGHRYDLHFEKGEIVGELKISDQDRKATGTHYHFRPDLEVFTDIAIPAEFYIDVLKKQAVVNAGLKFVFKNEIAANKYETHTFFYENGIRDYVSELAGEETLTAVQAWSAERRGRDRADRDDYTVKFEIAFCFSNQTAFQQYYHNSSFLEYGGSPANAVKSAFVYSISNYLKTNGRYNKNESAITAQDVFDCLCIITSGFSTFTSYENQTKKAINNRFIQDAMNDFLREKLEVYFIENKAEADRIAEQLLINKRAREQAESTRLNIKKKLTGSIDIQNRVQKFVDCRTRDASRRELYIVEGDSALGSVKLGRDAEFQAIMPVRGKILNCLKVELDRIFKSEIITDLIKVLGCGVESVKQKKELGTFSLENLNWAKIIICTDADVDGFHIRTMILAMIHRLVPTLIREGYVYIAESPLYEITTKTDTFFAYNEREKTEIIEKLGKTKYTLQRSKGLGENEPEMMWQTTMCPATRRLIRVMPEDAEKTAQVFDLLLGDNLAGRKEYIADNGGQWLELADIS
ncbi:MAG: DNA topoisomerase [Lentisphaeria bacterium]|nr:DNA topoisomerase [Oscillospiraceae bacterium]MBR2963481.1 DNA topoisomerase [Lentisphaeria bacterium]